MQTKSKIWIQGFQTRDRCCSFGNLVEFSFMEYRFGLFCFFFLTAVGQMNCLYSFLQLNRSGMTSQHLNIFHVEFSLLFYTVDISHNCRGHHSVYRSRQLFFFHAFCLRRLKKTCSIKLNIHKRLTHLPANIFNSFLG